MRRAFDSFRSTRTSLFVAAGLAGVSLLAACAGGTSAVTPTQVVAPAQAQFSIPVPKGSPKPKPAVFFADSTGNEIFAYLEAGKNQTAYETLTDSNLNGPQGLAADAAGDLYVANAGGQNLLMFPPGGTTVSKIFTDSNEFPYAVAACPNGTIVAGNERGVSSNGSATLYANGSTSPTGSITGGGLFQEVWGVACDSKSNIYISYYCSSCAPNTGYVYETDKNGNNGKTLPMETTVPGEIKIDKSGDIVVADIGTGQILFFKANQNLPFRTLPIIVTNYFVLDQKDANIWASNSDLFRYTAHGGKQTDDIPGASTRTGVATIPPD